MPGHHDSNMGALRRLEQLKRLVEAASGVEVSDRKIIDALVVLIQPGGQELRLTTWMVQSLREQLEHQDLINAVAKWALRTFGPEHTYAQCYPYYVARAKEAGFRPLSLKSFMNRALKEYGLENRRVKRPAPVQPFKTLEQLRGEGVTA